MDGKTAANFGLRKYITELRDYDHVFLSVEGAQYFARPFGLEPRVYAVEASPNEPKGLTLADGATSAVGIGAHELACQICEHVGVEYATSFGRGSQLRLACDALEQWCHL
jgi:hypothetical protein